MAKPIMNFTPVSLSEENAILVEQLNYHMEKAQEFTEALLQTHNDIKIIVSEIAKNSDILSNSKEYGEKQKI